MPEPSSQSITYEINTTARLAAKLGLSRWSVSRALNGRGGVSRETAQRVRQALREHHFEPDPLARGLRGGRTGTVGVCLPMFSPSAMHDGYDACALRGLASMDRRLREFDYLPVYEPVCGQPEREQAAVRKLLAMRVQAILMICPHSCAESPIFKAIRDKRLPGIAIAPREVVPITTAKADEKQAALLLARHVAALGHRNCALLGFSDGERKLQLITALREFGVEAISQGDFPRESRRDGRPALETARGREIVAREVARKRHASVVIAASDALALGAIRALRELSHRIPEDCSVASYGNSELAEASLPALTSVDLQTDLLIERSADLMCDQLRSPGRFETAELSINPILVHRDSIATAIAKTGARTHTI